MRTLSSIPDFLNCLTIGFCQGPLCVVANNLQRGERLVDETVDLGCRSEMWGNRQISLVTKTARFHENLHIGSRWPAITFDSDEMEAETPFGFFDVHCSLPLRLLGFSINGWPIAAPCMFRNTASRHYIGAPAVPDAPFTASKQTVANHRQ